MSKFKLDFQAVEWDEGDGLSIPAGSQSAHRAVSIIPGTLLFMVEEV